MIYFSCRFQSNKVPHGRESTVAGARSWLVTFLSTWEVGSWREGGARSGERLQYFKAHPQGSNSSRKDLPQTGSIAFPEWQPPEVREGLKSRISTYPSMR